jgi:hypothetical protein
MKETKDQKKEKQKAASELTKIANKVKKADNGNSKEVSRLYKIITNVISVLVHPIPGIQLVRILKKSLEQGKLVKSDIKKSAIDSRKKLLIILLTTAFLKFVHKVYREQVDDIVTTNIATDRMARESRQRENALHRNRTQNNTNNNSTQNNTNNNNGVIDPFSEEGMNEIAAALSSRASGINNMRTRLENELRRRHIQFTPDDIDAAINKLRNTPGTGDYSQDEFNYLVQGVILNSALRGANAQRGRNPHRTIVQNESSRYRSLELDPPLGQTPTPRPSARPFDPSRYQRRPGDDWLKDIELDSMPKHMLMTHDNMPWSIKRIRFIDDEKITLSDIPKAKDKVSKLIKIKDKIKQIKNKHPILGKLFKTLTKVILVITHPVPIYKLITTVKQSVMEIKLVKEFFNTKEGKNLNKTFKSILRVSLTVLINIVLLTFPFIMNITGMLAERTARRETGAAIRENNREIAEQERRRRAREEENRRNLNGPPPNPPSTGFEGRTRELDLDSAMNILKYNNHWAF